MLCVTIVDKVGVLPFLWTTLRASPVKKSLNQTIRGWRGIMTRIYMSFIAVVINRLVIFIVCSICTGNRILVEISIVGTSREYLKFKTKEILILKGNINPSYLYHI